MGTVGHVRYGGQPAPSKTGNLRTSRLQEDNMRTDWTTEDHLNTIVYPHFHYSFSQHGFLFSLTYTLHFTVSRCPIVCVIFGLGDQTFCPNVYGTKSDCVPTVPQF